MSSYDPFTVTVVYAPSPWLVPNQVVRIPVRCLISKSRMGNVVLDCATPLAPMPPGRGKARSRSEGAFRKALRAAMEQHLERHVRPFLADMVEWDESDTERVHGKER